MALRRRFKAIVTDLGLTSDLARLEAWRVARLWLGVDARARELEEAKQRREAGKGRRPGAGEVAKLEGRWLKAEGALSQALDRLRQVAAEQGQRDIEALYRA